jgi:LacI family transcriptional regulator
MPLTTETQDDPARLERVLNHVIERRVDAVIVTAARLGNAPILLDIARRRIPLLLADRNVPQTGLPSCTHDNEAGGMYAAKHLLDLGHRTLVQLRGPQDVSSFVDRGAAFSRTVKAAGDVEVDLGDAARTPSLQEGQRLARLLLAGRRDGRPTAVFAHNDLIALGALEVFADAGLRCPADISVVGYDDLPQVDRVTPPLTTVRLHGDELGRLVGEMTVAAIGSPDRPPSSLTLPPQLMVRASTGVPPG